MKSIMTRTPHDSSISFSRRHFNWIIARVESTVGSKPSPNTPENDEILGPNFTPSDAQPAQPAQPKTTLSRIRSSLISPFTSRPAHLGPRVIFTLYGPRRGNLRFAFQTDPHDNPSHIFELEIRTGSLVKEMANGPVRVAMECEGKEGKVRLIEERQWRAYCNGRKCGSAGRAEFGAGDGRVIRAVEPVTMGAGVLPEAEEEGEVMYMRARFERVVGNKDSEAFYMLSPNGKMGGSELSIYFLRV